MKHKWLLFLMIPISAFADQVIMSNVTNGCSSGLNTDTYLLATFTRNQYQCNSGYYVPANNDGCVMCPEYYDCNGGNFTFNEEYDQGNKFKKQVTENIRNGCKEDFLRAYNNVSNITATFTPNIHNCNLGYYLPANIDECIKCLNDHYCPGGTYTFNETTPQGIISCPENHPFAPAGMWLASQCGRKLHVGNYVMYLHQSPAHPTQHRLYTRVNGNIYSANMTLSDTTMNSQTERKLKVRFGNNTYYVFDDSMETNQ
jgi:hypothetical protein